MIGSSYDIFHTIGDAPFSLERVGPSTKKGLYVQIKTYDGTYLKKGSLLNSRYAKSYKTILRKVSFQSIRWNVCFHLIPLYEPLSLKVYRSIFWCTPHPCFLLPAPSFLNVIVSLSFIPKWHQSVLLLFFLNVSLTFQSPSILPLLEVFYKIFYQSVSTKNPLIDFV